MKEDVMNQGNDYFIGIAAFFAGALIGAGVALLLAPQSGEETRNMLRDYAGRANDELRDRARDAKATLENAVERGKEAFETVKERGKDFYESGRDTVRDAGKEAVKNRV